jgi:hypothetical protein
MPQQGMVAMPAQTVVKDYCHNQFAVIVPEIKLDYDSV